MKARAHHVYVAASNRLLTWSKEAFDRVVVKVGVSHSPTERQLSLNGRHPITGEPVTPCCGCRDWKIVTTAGILSEDDALDLEARFIAAFEPFDAYVRHAPPWPIPFRGAGEGELVLLPARPLIGTELLRFDWDVRDLYVAGRSGLLSAVKTIEPHTEEWLDDDQVALLRERAAYAIDMEDDRQEAQNRAALSRETGNYYED